MTKNEFLNYLHEGDFAQMFIECFWDRPTTTTPYPIGETSFSEVAQKKGYRIYVAKVEKLPDSAVRRQFDAKLRKRSQDYLAIYVSTREPFHHLWSIPVKTVDKRQLVTIEYVQDDQAAFLLEKMKALTFRDKGDVTIVDVVELANKTFLVNTENVTKKFYAGFRKQHDAFVKGIENLGAKNDREWYASVMLNRLMFCYFIQKKLFLDFNENYLSDKLKAVQAKKGKDKFYESFYRSFLKQLFSDGLDKPVSGRSDYFLKKYGRIPYLNGGMFSQHQIERENRDIDIPDKVFENLFAFFDQWHWHLDNRITASGRDINPDVLGYIFEQYINDRAQMGAYYTKEDITEYIGRNCIVPYLFEAVKKIDAKLFAKEGEVWSLLKESGDAYIFPAVKKGVDLPLPDYIERGVDTTKPELRARRARWNEKTGDAYALPTEIWRETVARRQRCMDIRAKIAGGDIADIHDFITYNLDIRAFAEDVIRKTSDRKLILHFYKAIREVTILDPTCGSGAFLFAALNILEPLYEACLDRMEDYHAANKNLFKEELGEIAGKFRSNRQYFIYKNIILRNLYGVDIMHEATEIARLRLFLKMVAVVDVDPYDDNLGLDPLPDIDFNIRCGNTLVGYATEKEIEAGLVNGDMFAFAELKDKIDAEMEKVSMAYDFFRREQLNLAGDHSQLVEAKKQIGQRLVTIRNLLDDQLYDRHAGKKKAQWLADTQPFHWYTEFYPIMHGRGGFDVIIGNPPYVEYSKVHGYSVDGYDTLSCNNLYAFTLERTKGILSPVGIDGMIVPLSIMCGERMEALRQIYLSNCKENWFANFEIFPSRLFDGAFQRVTIAISCGIKYRGTSHVTKLHRWYAKERNNIFNTICYTQGLSVRNAAGIAKLSSNIHRSIIAKTDVGRTTFLSHEKSDRFVYYQEATNYWMKACMRTPYYKKDGKVLPPAHGRYLYFGDTHARNQFFVFMNSSLFYLWYISFSDGFHLSDGLVRRFPLEKEDKHSSFDVIAETLEKEIKRNAIITTRNTSVANIELESFVLNKSKPIIDEIDELLAKHYGFTEEELDFIINYDIKYRMGDELNAE